jgi:hypothetical protein
MNHHLSISAPQYHDFKIFLLVSEKIRQIIEISLQISIISFNARITTRQVGEGAYGFGVVASEMHNFSLKLQTMMNHVHHQIFTLNRDLANWYKQRQTLDLFYKTQAQLNKTSVRLDGLIGRKQAELNALTQHIADNWVSLYKELKTTIKFCKKGKTFCHNAKIESAYAPQFQETLTQVADQFEEIMNKIILILDHLLNALALQA